jgi:hypothetical protein
MENYGTVRPFDFRTYCLIQIDMNLLPVSYKLEPLRGTIFMKESILQYFKPYGLSYITFAVGDTVL